jgi:ABC-type nitrate/sulfonate/bicarbonate transport system substrate-binding protein
MNRQRLSTFLVLTAVALGVAACGSSSSGSGSASTGSSQPETVRIVQATSPDFSDTPVYKAIDLMKAKGIDVTLSNINDPSSALRAVVSGQADVVMLSPSETATAVGNGGADLKYIATLYGASSYVILAQKGITLNNLDGKTLAIASMGSAGQIISAAALTKMGVDMSKIKYVVVGGTSARVTAILAGKVDLAPALAPAAVPATSTGKVDILLNTGAALGPYLQQGLIANGTWLKNPKTVSDVVGAFIDASRWASDPNNTQAFLQLAADNKLTGDLTADQQSQALQQLVKGNYYAINGAMCQASLDATIAYDVQSGALEKDKIPPQSQWFDPSIVQSYLAAKGQPKDAC